MYAEVVDDGVVGEAEADRHVRADAVQRERIRECGLNAEVVRAAEERAVASAQLIARCEGHGPTADRIDFGDSSGERACRPAARSSTRH